MWGSCTYCSSFFYGSGRFCSPKCEHDFLNPPAPKPKEIEKVCKFCGKKLKEDQKSYCSNSCKLESLGEHASRLTCKACGGNFLGYPKTRYCSVVCRESNRKMVKKFVPGKCRVCGKPCPAGEACCSWKCAVEYNAVR